MIKVYAHAVENGNTIRSPHKNPKGTRGGRRKKSNKDRTKRLR